MALVRGLRDSGVTIILTTHYIEEAEEMADRIGVIDKGAVVLVEDKVALMRKLGGKQLTIELRAPLDAIPTSLDRGSIERSSDGRTLTYTFDSRPRRPASPI